MPMAISFLLVTRSVVSLKGYRYLLMKLKKMLPVQFLWNALFLIFFDVAQGSYKPLNFARAILPYAMGSRVNNKVSKLNFTKIQLELDDLTFIIQQFVKNINACEICFPTAEKQRPRRIAGLACPSATMIVRGKTSPMQWNAPSTCDRSRAWRIAQSLFALERALILGAMVLSKNKSEDNSELTNWAIYSKDKRAQ